MMIRKPEDILSANNVNKDKILKRLLERIEKEIVRQSRLGSEFPYELNNEPYSLRKDNEEDLDSSISEIRTDFQKELINILEKSDWKLFLGVEKGYHFQTCWQIDILSNIDNNDNDNNKEEVRFNKKGFFSKLRSFFNFEK